MTWSKCEQCSHHFEFDEANETQPCPQCNFETRIFPRPRPLPPRPPSPSIPRGIIPADIPLNRHSDSKPSQKPERQFNPAVIAILLSVALVVAIGCTTGNLRELLGFYGLMILGALAYMLPAYVANRKGHHNAVAITVLNLFGGWTIIGWIVALVWAFTAPRPIGSR